MQPCPDAPFSIDEVLDTEPFALDRAAKAALYTRAMRDLTAYHAVHCPPYQRVINVLGYEVARVRSAADVPFLPVRLFKENDLLSVERAAVVKTMTSSGTSGQRVSKIFLDRDNAALQTKVLSKIVASFIGKRRLPMLIIDSKAVVKDRAMFSARGAGILGFSVFGHDQTYALDEQMQLDLPSVQAFLEKYAGQPLLLFGFTFIIWQQFYRVLARSGVRIDLSQAILIHGGGWKKLVDEAVDSATFRARLREVCGIDKVYNYYGMVEQTGSIFMECEQGHLHASIYSDVLIRSHQDFAEMPHGRRGLVQLVSLLPTSYPGHSLLSEDEGTVHGEDDCPCGRKGKYFSLHGRIKNAEVRGCSDAYVAGA
jgi:phenylacetate-coenzyme A ligase PaaK-like adenylate-forming protein